VNHSWWERGAKLTSSSCKNTMFSLREPCNLRRADSPTAVQARAAAAALQRKVTFADPLPSDPADILVAFRGWLDATKQGKAMRIQHKRGSSGNTVAEDNSTPPEHWQKAALSDDSTAVFAHGSWESVPEVHYRPKIKALAPSLWKPTNTPAW
jgi:hypothetical protein